MNLKIALLSAACALALAACGGDNTDQGNTQENTPPPASTQPAPATTATPAPTATSPAQQQSPAMPPPAAGEPAQGPATAAPAAPAAGAGAAAGDGKVAVVNDCATEIEGNDAMQFNVNAIRVPASCTEFSITLKHVGKLPENAMGHNVVISTEADMQAVNAEGMAAGLDNDYVKPDDQRVIAYSEIIGGGETTEFSFDVASIKDGGPYVFFCSFPGHAALMRGSISVE